MLIRVFLSLLLTLLLTFAMPSSVMAKDTATEGAILETDSIEDTNKPKEKNTTVTKTPAPKTNTKSRPSEREFDPSEEISKDLSVPFPVDI